MTGRMPVKNILLVYDQPGWIFHSHCIEIKNRLSGEYNIEMTDHRQNILELAKSVDCTYVMDPMPMQYPPKEKVILGLRNQFLYEDHPEGASGLYFHGFSGKCVSLNRCCILHMVNRNQMRVFEPIVDHGVPLLLVQHGVNTEEIFDKSKYHKPRNGVLVVGASGRNSGNKRFNIINSACKKTGCVFRVAEYNGNRLVKEQMPSFYNSIDVLVNVSKSEGQNNGLMEAGSMQIPVIASRTGAAEEMVRDGENGLLIDRTEDALVDALNKMKDEKVRMEMGENLYNEVMRNWTWKVRIEDYRKMFNLFFERAL